ncbi:opine metallophore biosynthesis dehydrogenase [Xylanibacillus composti]|uniref:DUF2338 family protein n=1 Tax=Xylanibacillus composti TaxID=1572762 RepID=A0A8J4M1B5_9BACL|nr:opine metallophore biosynthesis dehydrogenase [Xylanibacillus composti]GIQ68374.1 hypothetical protein XYCOK13_11980 [Xylanibacillus composti]
MRHESKPAIFGNTLIIGAGPAGIHAAVSWSRVSNRIGLLNREGEHARQVRKLLADADFHVQCDVLVSGKEQLSGSAKIHRYYEGYQELDPDWDTVLLCTPSDHYGRILGEWPGEMRRKVKQLILLSPGIGSNALVQSLLGEHAQRIEVVSLSTYYAASKFMNARAPLTSVVKGIKRKIRLASGRRERSVCIAVSELIQTLGVQCEIVDTPLEAESHSITTYVHPPLFMNTFSLNEIFSLSKSSKYMYKLYPEGPITPHVMRSMVHLWKEVSRVLQKLEIQPVNLLKFLNDDNYPVHEQSISRAQIEEFPSMDAVMQEYLLYVRYSSLLIDPFSAPDEQGRYYDFSAVPYRQVVLDRDGCWQIPRVPHEDYYKLKVLCEVAIRLEVPMPQARSLIEQYRNKLFSFLASEGTGRYHPDFIEDHAEEQAAAVLKTTHRNVQIAGE